MNREKVRQDLSWILQEIETLFTNRRSPNIQPEERKHARAGWVALVIGEEDEE